MKKLLALILALSMLFVFTACGDNESSAQPSPTEPKTTEEETTAADDDYFYDEPIEYEPVTTPVSEWGFYNIDEMEGLVQISGYNLTEGFVFYRGDWFPDIPIMRFLNGRILVYDIDEDDYSVYSKAATEYYIIDNDNLQINSYSNSLISITERKTSSKYPGFVCLVSNRWYVPYSLIDWDRGIEYYDYNSDYPDDDYNYKITVKFYLKDIS